MLNSKARANLVINTFSEVYKGWAMLCYQKQQRNEKKAFEVLFGHTNGRYLIVLKLFILCLEKLFHCI